MIDRLRRLTNVLDWRWMIAGGLGLGLVLGLTAALRWDHPAFLLAWAALLLGLGWAGWDVRPRQVGRLGSAKAASLQLGRRVRDGPFVMVELGGGTFLMGSPNSDSMADSREKPRHDVSVSGFRMCRTLVTLGQWRSIMGGKAGEGDDDYPVSDVSWEDAVRFCNALSVRERYRPCYRRLGIGRWSHWLCDWRADGYRLPTEAEWEYACRAGTDAAWSFGDEAEDLGEHAWFGGNSGGELHPVALKRPNPWGLHDMHGNLLEWCWDWYGDYPAGKAHNPRGPAFGQLRWRVLRGGSFDDPPVNLRSANRSIDEPLFGIRIFGFRCVRVPARQR